MKAPEQELTDEEAEGILQEVSASDRKAAAKSGAAISDGSYPIRNARELKAAIKLVGRSKDHSTGEVKAHIRKRAKALGLTSLLPESWVTQENDGGAIVTTLCLEDAAVPDAVIVQEATSENGGTMLIKVPFYVSGSLSRAPGYRKRLYFGKEILQEVVNAGQRRIDAGREKRGPGLKTYARHAHATSQDGLPVGGPVSLEHDGRVGYATIEVVNTSMGRDVQELIRTKHLNAVSLRARESVLKPGRINGEEVLMCESLGLDGIDFAPDSPAQETYGIEILNEEAVVQAGAEATEDEEVETDQPHTGRSELAEIKLEDVPADVREQIEAPLRKELEGEREKTKVLVQELDERKLSEYISDVASKHPESEKMRTVLQELSVEKGCKTPADLSAHVAPILLEALNAREDEKPEPKAAPADQLRKLFPTRPSGSGSPTLTQEGDGGADEKPVLLESEFAVGGLAIPE